MNHRLLLAPCLVAVCLSSCGTPSRLCPVDDMDVSDRDVFVVAEFDLLPFDAGGEDEVDVVMVPYVVHNKTVDQRCDDMGGGKIFITSEGIVCPSVDH